MGLDKPGNNNDKVEKGNETGEGSTEQTSEKFIADNRSEEKKGAVQAQDDRAQTPNSSLKVLPRVDMYDFHQGGARPVSGDRGLSPAAQAQAQAQAEADAKAKQPQQVGKVQDATTADKPQQSADAKPAPEQNPDAKPGQEVAPQNADAKPAKDGKAPDAAADQVQPPAEAKNEKPNEGMTAAEAEHMKAFREKLEKENFNLKAIEKGWGPYQALEAMVKEGKIKMTPAEMKAEAERIRNREFKELGRQHFKVGESPKRWSQEEMDKMAQGELKNFRDAEEKRVAAEKKAEEERQRVEAEKQLRDQTAVALEKHIPAQDKLQNAAKGIGLNISDEQMKEFRDRLKEHTFKEIARGTMKPEDLERPMPRVGGVFVAMGAVKEEQLNEVVQKQEEMRKAGQKPPQLGDMLKEQLKGNKEALARLDLASKFYDKLYEEVTGKPRVAPAAPADQTQKAQPAQPEKLPDPKLKVRR
jgi:hypothetical protein